jgi:23S rRNA (adenine2503-C2)-methyltransferase
MDTGELSLLARELGQPGFRGKQMARWVYQHGATSVEEMTDLPLAFRQQLAAEAQVGKPERRLTQRAADGTTKALVAMADGETVETVYLPYPDRQSACVSTQVGCPAACAFCATGTLGLRRNLTAGEIAGQVLVAQDMAAEQAAERRVNHVVLMGMGEPLLNYAASLKAVRLINEEIGVGMRSITLSTVGIIPAIRRLAEERLQLTLSVSLHAPNQPLRRKLVPIAANYPLDELLAACVSYAEATGRRITYEYVLLEGVNDGRRDAQELGRLLKGQLCHVNLIPFNPGPTLSPFATPKPNQASTFRGELEAQGVPATVRQIRGQEIAAACGQLKEAASGHSPLLDRARPPASADLTVLCAPSR